MTETSSTKKQPRYRAIAIATLLTGALLLPMAAHSKPLNSGGGVVTATVEYLTPASGLPPLDGRCAKATQFTIQGSSAFVFNFDAAPQFAGLVTLSGTGTSGLGCESYGLGGGQVTLSAHGVGATDPSSKFDCDTLKGNFTRVASDMTLILAGKCSVNGSDTGMTQYIARLQLIPEGDGITAPVKRASLTGTITVVTV